MPSIEYTKPVYMSMLVLMGLVMPRTSRMTWGPSRSMLAMRSSFSTWPFCSARRRAYSRMISARGSVLV